MNTLDEAAQRRIEALEADVAYYKSLADLLQAALDERDEELRAALGQLRGKRLEPNYPADVA